MKASVRSPTVVIGGLITATIVKILLLGDLA